ncbi:hypothetical protein [Petroclostridium xylanilyticum]|uniref:hypothetical protein n=1 Tax=Petroclostridium xylanilyticum TaxID=1792311 RepID=UPI0018E30208|nr:hypothetical protein [Petroclostridium xylanilyticum]
MDCLLYGRLIAIVLMFVMYSALQQLMYLNKQRSISMILFIKLIATKADIISKTLL